jgi:ketosteroid isomerase-like protein
MKRNGDHVEIMTSTKDVIDNHIQRFHEGNIEGILDGYTTDAILFTPAGPLKGRNEIKTLFQRMLAEFAKPGASDTVHTATFEGDYAYLIWSAETADNIYEIATDTFFVRDGKIVVQSFAAKISPRH